jgi:hypothetical protein
LGKAFVLSPVQRTAGILTIAMFASAAQKSAAQETPLAPARAEGQTVTPAFEGWYRNPDGSFSLSFGYFNRNTKEVIEIPIGPDNAIQPAGPDRGQPSRFEPRRHWGVFAVKVPADFGETNKVTWTLKVRGQTFAIPGSLKAGWEIDALEGEAGSGNTPPSIRFDTSSPAARGPGGAVHGPLSAQVGTPLTITIWSTDDGKAHGSIASDGREDVPVTLTWYKHRGSGAVAFANASPPVGAADGKSSVSVTFAEAGEYVLRVRASDASGVVSAGHAQCCWTNGFVHVTVTR